MLGIFLLLLKTTKSKTGC